MSKFWGCWRPTLVVFLNLLWFASIRWLRRNHVYLLVATVNRSIDYPQISNTSCLFRTRYLCPSQQEHATTWHPTLTYPKSRFLLCLLLLLTNVTSIHALFAFKAITQAWTPEALFGIVGTPRGNPTNRPQNYAPNVVIPLFGDNSLTPQPLLRPPHIAT